MKRLAAIMGLAATAVLALPPSVAPAGADSPSLMTKRLNSCGTSAFEEVSGAAPAYRHKNFGVTGPVYVGEAILEWCQHAQNAVIYFYVDDPGRPEHDACPESMSLAIWPGRGEEAETIIRNNVPGYYAPNVEVIEEPVVGPFPMVIAGKTVDAYKLEAVLIDSAGFTRRQKMIGFADSGHFVRIMTGVVDDAGCANDVTASFMGALNWPA